MSAAVSAGMGTTEIADYERIKNTEGLAAANAALDRYLAEVPAYYAAQAQLQAQLQAQEAAKQALAEQWLEDNAAHTQAEMAEAQEEQQLKDAAAQAQADAAAQAAAEASKPWWQKAIDFVDQHQTQFAIGIGVAAGALAIILTAGTATPLVLAAGVAALGAGAVVGAGTVGLNAYYDRSWDQNLVRNVGFAATAATVATVAPAFIEAGQSVIATAVPYLAAMAGVPAAAAVSLGTVVAPLIGYGTSALALGSMALGGAGMSMSLDPTLSDAERQMGTNMSFAALLPLTAAQGMYSVSAEVNAGLGTGGTPAIVPTAKIVYDASTGNYISTVDGAIIPPDEMPWPTTPPNGFAVDPWDRTLEPGEIIDRYGTITIDGKINGRYAGVPGETISERGMAPGCENMPYTKMVVVKPIPVKAGPAAGVSDFAADGQGIQFMFKEGLQYWIDNGSLRIIP